MSTSCYVMLTINVSMPRRLAELLSSRRSMVSVNLIPYNPVDEHSQYQRSTEESILGFYDTLKKNNINSTVRMEHGTDIDAACGQLRSKQMKNNAAESEPDRLALG